MNRSGASNARRNTTAQTATVLFILLAIIIAVALGLSSVVLRDQGASSLRTSILNAANQCCAVEGSYPSSLAYLEEHYGLTINRTDFAVSYEIYAPNVPPAVRVVPR